MKKRSTISDYVCSLLSAEIVNRCPMCGEFEQTLKSFTNHHINGDPSVSDYWNLIRLYEKCHGLEEQKADGKLLRKVKQRKKDLFRRLIGDAAYQTLLLARDYATTSTLPSLCTTLINMDLIDIVNGKILNYGETGHGTIVTIKLTGRGREFIEKLSIEDPLPDLGWS